MNYSEKIVTNEFLKDDVLCYWEMVGSIPSSEGLHSRYLPKGQSLLIFNYGDKIKLSSKIIESPFFTVPAIASSLIITQTGKINLIGISFIGDGLYKLLNDPLSDVAQQLSQDLSHECHKLYIAIDKLEFQDKTKKIEAFLLNHLNRNKKNDAFNQAIQIINKKKGKLKIRSLSNDLQISERHLQRLFKTRLNLSPKDYCKIIRVNNYMEFILERNKPVDWMDLVVEFGYHDQPHLINEVRAVSKLSPKKLLKFRDTLFHRYNTY